MMFCGRAGLAGPGGGPAGLEQAGDRGPTGREQPERPSRPSRPNRSPLRSRSSVLCCATRLHDCSRFIHTAFTNHMRSWLTRTHWHRQPLLSLTKERSVWGGSVLNQRSFYKGEKPCGHAAIQPWQAVCGELCCNRAVTDASAQLV